MRIEVKYVFVEEKEEKMVGRCILSIIGPVCLFL